jgi:hypothetical protein
MFVLVIRRPYPEPSPVSCCSLKDFYKIADDRFPVIIDLKAGFGTFNVCCAITLDCKPDTAASRVIRCKPVHVKHSQVDACRSHDGYGPFTGLEGILLSLISKGLDDRSRLKCLELIFHKVKIATADLHDYHRCLMLYCLVLGYDFAGLFLNSSVCVYQHTLFIRRMS